MKNKINSRIVFINSLATILILLPISIVSAGIVPDCDGSTCNFDYFLLLIKNVVNFAVTIGIALSALVFAWAGWLYMSSGGDEGKIKEAHEIFIKVLWGFLFALGAYLIVQLIATSLGAKPDFVKI